MITQTPTVETPTDSPKAPTKMGPKPRKKTVVLDDMQGDYRIYELAGRDSGLPTGALLPIAEIPGFRTQTEAVKFAKNSGDRLKSKQFMILKAIEVGLADVQTATTVVIKWKPKKAAEDDGPEAEGE